MLTVLSYILLHNYVGADFNGVVLIAPFIVDIALGDIILSKMQKN